MREVRFLRQHSAKWKEFESLLHDDSSVDPNRLCDLFVEITDDLSYAQTYYPGTKTTTYLNALSARVHQRLYRNKRERVSRFISFWIDEFPEALYATRRLAFVSFVIVLVAAALGVLSMYFDQRFARLILGDGYVNMTQENILNGDPMGVYKRNDGLEMFFQIALNNQMVALRIFVSGLLGGLGTVYMLFQNGVMLGVFQTMFVQRGALVPSLQGIWLHGTLEISGMIFEGAAGLALGTSILFPKNFSRLDAFRRGASLGMKIMVGLFPQVIVAALLESFVTRFCSDLPILSWCIIIVSLSFVVWYYIVYPHKRFAPTKSVSRLSSANTDSISSLTMDNVL